MEKQTKPINLQGSGCTGKAFFDKIFLISSCQQIKGAWYPCELSSIASIRVVDVIICWYWQKQLSGHPSLLFFVTKLKFSQEAHSI